MRGNTSADNVSDVPLNAFTTSLGRVAAETFPQVVILGAAFLRGVENNIDIVSSIKVFHPDIDGVFLFLVSFDVNNGERFVFVKISDAGYTAKGKIRSARMGGP